MNQHTGVHVMFRPGQQARARELLIAAGHDPGELTELWMLQREPSIHDSYRILVEALEAVDPKWPDALIVNAPPPEAP